MKKNFSTLMVGALTTFPLLQGCQEKQPSRPNILYIMTDDQGVWTPGYMGHPTAFTPNLDQLRKEGVLFENAFANTPVCSPSRATLITGLYLSQHGIGDYIPKNSDQGLHPTLPTWPRLLQKAGYTTGLVGKWHLGHKKAQHHPLNYGYDQFLGLLEGGCIGKDPMLWAEGEIKPFEGLMVDILTNKAINFIQEQKEKPFALSVHYRAPHTPYLPVSEEDWAHHKDADTWAPDYPGMDPEKVKKKMKQYNAAVTGIDRSVGRLMKSLEQLGLAENTIVIFTSDHGYNMGHHGVWAKGNGVWMVDTTWAERWPHITKAWRPNMWDTSIRVPFIVRWPGVTKPNTTISETLEFIDLFPTICDMAGAKVPKEFNLPGESVVPLLKGKSVKWDQTVYGEYDMEKQNGGTQSYMRMIRTQEWKLMIDLKNEGRGDLYNHKEDPKEENNLFESQDPEILKVKEELMKRLDSYM